MIRKFEISNLKCFKEPTTVHLNNLTIMAGINSIGKSTFIQALLLLRQTFDEAKKRNFSQFETLKILLNDVYCLQLGNSTEVLNSNAGEDDKIKFNITMEDDRVQSFAFNSSRSSIETFIEFENENQFLKVIEDTSIFTNQFQYLNTERIGPRVTQKISSFDFPSTGFQGEYTAYAIARDPDFKVEEAKRFPFDENMLTPTILKQVEYWLDYLFPGIEIHVEPNIKRKYVGLGLRRRGADTEYLDPSNLGYGVSYILPILVSGLLAEKGTMLIVENPEVHLHPAAQSKIGLFLAKIASSGVQVIIETHSEHVINGARLASLREQIPTDKLSINFFNLDDDLKTTYIEHIQINHKAELTKWPKGFLDQEQSDLREMIKLRRGN